MADERTLEIVIRARDEASKVLKDFSGQATSLSSSIKDGLSRNVVQLGAAFAATSGFIYSSIGAYEESQNATAQLNAVLASTKNIAGVTASSVLNLSAAL